MTVPQPRRAMESGAVTGGVRWNRAIWAYAGLAAATAVLLRAGGGSLSVPFGSGQDLGAWLEATPPPVVAMALVRLAALGTCGYLAVALTAALVAGLDPCRRLAVLVGQMAPATLRRAVVYGARSGLATTVALGWLPPLAAAGPTGAAPAAARTPLPDDPSSHTASLSRHDPLPGAAPAAARTPLPDDPSSHTASLSGLGPPDALPDATAPAPANRARPTGTSGTSGPDTPRSASTRASGDRDAEHTTRTGGPASTEGNANRQSDSTATMVRLPTPPRPPTPAPGGGQPAGPSPSASTPASRPPPAPGAEAEVSGTEEWVVGPGESFWSIAEEALSDARGGIAPDDVDVSRYWRQLIAANRHRLAAPDNPDLLLVGQVLVLPPPS